MLSPADMKQITPKIGKGKPEEYEARKLRGD